MKNWILSICLISTSIIPFAQVKYDEGRLSIYVKDQYNDTIAIQLLQGLLDSNEYYYLPQYPHLSKKGNNFEISCIKYVGENEEANGGLFHALVKFTLPADLLEQVEKKLQSLVPNARLAGPVPMRQAVSDGENGMASFKIVSSILNENSGFTNAVITSGHAPLLPDSRAAIAAKLNQHGATLLWESLQSPTSDISVTISGSYEAAVRGYNATVSADVSTIYEHLSTVVNLQKDFSKRHLRKISDELVQNQMLKIEVFDRSKGLDIKNDDMQGILDLVTEKITELMFDTQVGWAKIPAKETAVEAGQIKGRQKKGWFARVFGGHDNPKYVTDDQIVMKQREDIRTNTFYLNLSKSTTINVPFFASGNLGGLYNEHQDNSKYFKVVNLDDPDFQLRDILFQVDGNFAESFKDILNFVSVNFKKKYNNGNNDDIIKSIIINKDDIEKGEDLKSIAYPRLGKPLDEWLNYEYQIAWSLKGENKTIQIPATDDEWLTSNQPILSLIPPFSKRIVEIDADRSLFTSANVATASIKFYVILNGEPIPQKTVILRATDAEKTTKIALYHDKEEPVAYQITWYSADGKKVEDPKVLTDDYMFIVPQN